MPAPATHAALREAYEPIFATIIWTGWVGRPWELPAHEAWVDCESQGGGFNYMCLTNVMQEARLALASCALYRVWCRPFTTAASECSFLGGV